MQASGGGIKSDVSRSPLLFKIVVQFLLVGGLLDEATLSQNVD
jgi:hypothetical protein